MVRATRGGVGAVCLLLGLAACQSDGSGGGAVGLVGITSGVRLHPVAWYAAGGAALFDHWDDAALATECAFALAVDGRWRCLPSGGSAIDHADERYFFFADAACTAPLAAPQPGSPTPRYVLGPPTVTPACDEAAGRPVHEVGAAWSSSTAYQVEQGGCVEVSIAGPFDFYEVGAEVAADEFVAAELVVEPAADRLAPHAFVAEDGAIERRAIWDTERDAECIESGDGACRPAKVASATGFLWADDACTVPAAAVDGRHRACAPVTAASTGSGLFELGAPVAPEDLHVGVGTCTLADPGVVSGEAFEIGAPIDLTTLPALDEVRDGGGRVRGRRRVDASGAVLVAADGFLDTALDERCTPELFRDGARCVPSVVAIAGYFVDPGCSQPLIWAGGDELPPHAFIYPDEQAGVLPAAPQVYRLGPMSPVTEPYMRDSAGACRPWQEVNPSLSNRRFATLGERIELPALELR